MSGWCPFLPQRSPRPEGGGDFAPALGGGSGAKRDASIPQTGRDDLLLPSRSEAVRMAQP